MIDLSILRAIESPQFRFDVNKAASLAHFIDLVTDQLPFSAVVDELRADPQAHAQLMRRIVDLARLDTDYRYENPYDTPIAVYVLALRAATSAYASSAARSLASTQRLWWADRVAANVIAEQKHVTRAAEHSAYLPMPTNLLVYATYFSTAARDVYTMRVPDNIMISNILLSDYLVVQPPGSVQDPNTIRPVPYPAQMGLFPREVIFPDNSTILSSDYEQLTVSP